MVASSEKRPAEILQEDSQFIVMANFRYLYQFWITRIPKSAVDQVVVRIDRFPTSIPLIKPAHTLLVFKMKDGFELQLSSQPSNG
jgi:hypothetical protein